MSIEDDIRKKLEDEKKPTGESDTYPSLKDSTYEELSVSLKNEEDDVNIISFKMDDEILKSMKFLSIICKIFAVFIIVCGVIHCSSIIGAIIGIPFILIGLKSYKTGDNLNQTVIKKNGENLRLAIIYTAQFVKYYLIILLITLSSFILFIFVTFIYIFIPGILSNIFY